VPKWKTNKPPRFTLSRVGSALEDAKQVPVVLRAKLTEILEHLASEGCHAADYALSGPPPWPHLCAVHFDGWRVVIAFPSEDEVTIVKIARHDPSSDPYREIAEDLVSPCPPSRGRSRRAANPTANHPSIRSSSNVQAAFAALTQRERRQRSRR
jgi:hypothetical protein